MKVLTMIMALAIMGMASCNSTGTKPGNEPSAPIEAKEKGIDIPLTAFAHPKDLVCGMELEEGSIADTATLGTDLYGFCATGCKEAFIKEPQAYLNQK